VARERARATTGTLIPPEEPADVSPLLPALGPAPDPVLLATHIPGHLDLDGAKRRAFVAELRPWASFGARERWSAVVAALAETAWPPGAGRAWYHPVMDVVWILRWSPGRPDRAQAASRSVRTIQESVATARALTGAGARDAEAFVRRGRW
jgi:hypothetical protein